MRKKQPDQEQCPPVPGLTATLGSPPDRIKPDVLFEKAPLAMFIVDRDRRLCCFNEAAAAMASRVQESAIGMRGGEFFRCINAFDDPRGCGYSPACESCVVRRMVLDTFQTGMDHRSVEASIPVGAEDGIQKIWVLLSTALVKLPDKDGVLVCLKDITDRKRAEEALRRNQRKFKLVMETIEKVFWMSTCGIGEMLYVSPAYEVLWERSRESLYRSPRSFMEAIHSDDRDMYSDVLANYHKQGKPYECEYRIVRRDGSIRWVCEKGYPVPHSFGKVKLMSGVCTDITELKLTEETLRKKNDELLLKGKFASLFLMSINDEVFSGVLELLLGEFESQYGYFGYIDEEGDLMCPSTKNGIREQCRIPKNSIVFKKEFWAGLCGKSLQERIPIRQNHGLDIPQGHVPLRNALIVPLLLHKTLIGQIALANKPAGYTQKDEEKLVSIANFVAPILQIYLDKEKAKNQLLYQAEKLRERNIALKVLLETRGQEKRQQVEKITRNFEKLVFPYYEKLLSCHDKEDRRTLLEIIESNTRACLFADPPPNFPYGRELTPMEIQVADLIKSGKTSKEIAALLNISPRSVYFHRNNLRRKLNIHKTKTNLKTYLVTRH